MEQGDTQLLDQSIFLKDFKLSDKDIQIPFKKYFFDLYKIDTEKRMMAVIKWFRSK